MCIQNSGYVAVNGACAQCQANCLQCTSPTVCTQCINGYGLYNNTCQLCKVGCQTCDGNLTACFQCFPKFYYD